MWYNSALIRTDTKTKKMHRTIFYTRLITTVLVSFLWACTNDNLSTPSKNAEVSALFDHGYIETKVTPRPIQMPAFERDNYRVDPLRNRAYFIDKKARLVRILNLATSQWLAPLAFESTPITVQFDPNLATLYIGLANDDGSTSSLLDLDAGSYQVRTRHALSFTFDELIVTSFGKAIFRHNAAQLSTYYYDLSLKKLLEKTERQGMAALALSADQSAIYTGQEVIELLASTTQSRGNYRVGTMGDKLYYGGQTIITDNGEVLKKQVGIHFFNQVRYRQIGRHPWATQDQSNEPVHLKDVVFDDDNYLIFALTDDDEIWVHNSISYELIRIIKPTINGISHLLTGRDQLVLLSYDESQTQLFSIDHPCGTCSEADLPSVEVTWLASTDNPLHLTFDTAGTKLNSVGSQWSRYIWQIDQEEKIAPYYGISATHDITFALPGTKYVTLIVKNHAGFLSEQKIIIDKARTDESESTDMFLQPAFSVPMNMDEVVKDEKNDSLIFYNRLSQRLYVTDIVTGLTQEKMKLASRPFQMRITDDGEYLLLGLSSHPAHAQFQMLVVRIADFIVEHEVTVAIPFSDFVFIDTNHLLVLYANRLPAEVIRFNDQQWISHVGRMTGDRILDEIDLSTGKVSRSRNLGNRQVTKIATTLNPDIFSLYANSIDDDHPDLLFSTVAFDVMETADSTLPYVQRTKTLSPNTFLYHHIVYQLDRDLMLHPIYPLGINRFIRVADFRPDDRVTVAYYGGAALIKGAPGSGLDRSIKEVRAATHIFQTGGSFYWVSENDRHPIVYLTNLNCVECTATGSAVQASFLADFAGDLTTDTPVTFDASASRDSKGRNTTLEYEWDFDGDGYYDTARSPTSAIEHAFHTPGTKAVTLRVREDDRHFDTHVITLEVAPSNSRYVIPEPGTPFQWNFTSQQSLKDDERQKRYFNDLDAKRIYFVDMQTGHIDRYIQFKDTPSRMTMSLDRKRLYVVLKRSPSTNQGDGLFQPGYLVEINLASQTLTQFVTLDIDPFDVTTNENGPIVSGRMELLEKAKEFSEVLKFHRKATIVQYNWQGTPQFNRVFEANVERATLPITWHENHGLVLSLNSWLYQFDVQSNQFFEKSRTEIYAGVIDWLTISPDGLYLFSNLGWQSLATHASIWTLKHFVNLNQSRVLDIFYNTQSEQLFLVTSRQIVRYHTATKLLLSLQTNENVSYLDDNENGISRISTIDGITRHEPWEACTRCRAETPPIAQFQWTQVSSNRFTFDASASIDAETSLQNLKFVWYIDSDPANYQSLSSNSTIEFRDRGDKAITLVVIDESGLTDRVTQHIQVGSTGFTDQGFYFNQEIDNIKIDYLHNRAYVVSGRQLHIMDLLTNFETKRFALQGDIQTMVLDGTRLVLALRTDEAEHLGQLLVINTESEQVMTTQDTSYLIADSAIIPLGDNEHYIMLSKELTVGVLGLYQYDGNVFTLISSLETSHAIQYYHDVSRRQLIVVDFSHIKVFDISNQKFTRLSETSCVEATGRTCFSSNFNINAGFIDDAHTIITSQRDIYRRNTQNTFEWSTQRIQTLNLPSPRFASVSHPKLIFTQSTDDGDYFVNKSTLWRINMKGNCKFDSLALVNNEYQCVTYNDYQQRYVIITLNTNCQACVAEQPPIPIITILTEPPYLTEQYIVFTAWDSVDPESGSLLISQWNVEQEGMLTLYDELPASSVKYFSSGEKTFSLTLINEAGITATTQLTLQVDNIQKPASDPGSVYPPISTSLRVTNGFNYFFLNNEIYTIDNSGRVVVFNKDTGELERVFDFPFFATRLLLSPDRQHLVVVLDASSRYVVYEGEELGKFIAHIDLNSQTRTQLRFAGIGIETADWVSTGELVISGKPYLEMGPYEFKKRADQHLLKLIHTPDLTTLSETEIENQVMGIDPARDIIYVASETSLVAYQNNAQVIIRRDDTYSVMSPTMYGRGELNDRIIFANAKGILVERFTGEVVLIQSHFDPIFFRDPTRIAFDYSRQLVVKLEGYSHSARLCTYDLMTLTQLDCASLDYQYNENFYLSYVNPDQFSVTSRSLLDKHWEVITVSHPCPSCGQNLPRAAMNISRVGTINEIYTSTSETEQTDHFQAYRISHANSTVNVDGSIKRTLSSPLTTIDQKTQWWPYEDNDIFAFFAIGGTYDIGLTLKDSRGYTASALQTVHVPITLDPGESYKIFVNQAIKALVTNKTHMEIVTIAEQTRQLYFTSLTTGHRQRIVDLDCDPISLQINSMDTQLYVGCRNSSTTPYNILTIDYASGAIVRQNSIDRVPKQIEVLSSTQLVIADDASMQTLNTETNESTVELAAGVIHQLVTVPDKNAVLIAIIKNRFDDPTVATEEKIAYAYYQWDSTRLNLMNESVYQHDYTDAYQKAVFTVLPIQNEILTMDGQLLTFVDNTIEYVKPIITSRVMSTITDSTNNMLYVVYRKDYMAGEMLLRLDNHALIKPNKRLSYLGFNINKLLYADNEVVYATDVSNGKNIILANDQKYYLDTINVKGSTIARLPSFCQDCYLDEAAIANFSVENSLELQTGVPVVFNTIETADSEQDQQFLQKRWDWTSDGIYDSEFSMNSIVSHIFHQPGEKTVTLQIQDQAGNQSTISQTLTIH